jgi:hypothetical protein
MPHSEGSDCSRFPKSLVSSDVAETSCWQSVGITSVRSRILLLFIQSYLCGKSEGELSNARGWQTALLGVSRTTHRWKRCSRLQHPIPHSFVKAWSVYIGFWLKPSPTGIILLTFSLNAVLVQGPFKTVIITSNLIRTNTLKDRNITLTFSRARHSLYLRSVTSLDCIIYVRMLHSSRRVRELVMNTLGWKFFSMRGYP